MKDFVITFDPGSSLAKALVEPCGDNVYLLTLDPSITEFQSHTGQNQPNNDWVEFNGRRFAIGTFARSIALYNTIRIAKYEKAAVSIAALLGKIAEKHGIDNFSIRLFILLPWGEYQHRHLLNEILDKQLAQFTYKRTPLTVKLLQYDAKPEGCGGIFSIGKMNKPISQSCKFSIMIGYRNASYLYWNKGAIERGTSEDIGFQIGVEQVRANGPILEAVSDALIETILKPKLTQKDLFPYCQSLSPENKAREIEQIRAAIRTAKKNYWTILRGWLNAIQIPKVDEVILLGGTSHAYREKIDRELKNHEEVDWRDLVENRIQMQLNVPQLSYRLIDLWAYQKYAKQLLSKEINQ